MRILLTGGDGFTGRHLSQRAAAAGHEVVPVTADLREPARLREALRGEHADAVVHLAAISYVAHQDERAFYDVNLFGTLNLLEALHAAGVTPSRIVLASSANVYGNCERSPIAETEPPAPVNHYAMSKLAMEHLAVAKAPRTGLTFVRPFNYTGPGQPSHFVIPKLVDHFRRRAPEIALGNVEVQREYNDVRFTCDALLALLRPDTPTGTYNICTGVPHSLGEVIGLLEELTDHHPRITRDPALVRPQEIHRLCGDPARLRAACGTLPAYTLRETLAWMLEATP